MGDKEKDVLNLSDKIAKEYYCEDEDVVWEGSPLHEHLINQNLEIFPHASSCVSGGKYTSLDVNEEAEDRHNKSKFALPQVSNGAVLSEKNGNANQMTSESSILSSSTSYAWPKSRRLEVLQVEVARQLLESDLLVQEDEDFINNFLLTDAALEDYHKYASEGGTSSILGDVLLFSGSVAAVAGAVFFLSERTRAVGAAAAAALLPTALAFGTASTTRISTKMSEEEEKSNFDTLIKRLLGDMQLFKKLVRKCLNLLQGMELIHAGNMLAINSKTGAPMASVQAHSSSDIEQSCLSKALTNRAAFPALRKAAYQCTIQLITAYRSAVEKLMKVSPLADHVDLKDHYIAFIELKNFGIEEDWKETMHSMRGEEISVKMLKDTVQIALVQQSEYLRRFGLVFCENVREDYEGTQHPLDKAGVLKHIGELIETLNKINNKLSRVFDYHEAMGIDLTKDDNQKALTKAKSKYKQFDFVPLRSVYTSLFSTGLHLQNSLLRVRELEKIFDLMEKRKSINESDIDSNENAQVSIQTGPTQAEIVQWLKGFEEIQGELNACVGCLEDGVTNIDRLQTNDKSQNENTDLSIQKVIHEHQDTQNDIKFKLPVVPLVDNNDPGLHLDEVFEADMVEEDNSNRIFSANGNEKFGEDHEFQKRLKSEKRLMQELKSVLTVKQEEHQKREAKAIERQKGTSNMQMNDTALPCNGHVSSNQNCEVNSSPNVEQDNEYTELVINCNHTTSGSAVTNKSPIQSKKVDPFLNGNECINHKSETKSSKKSNRGFEDSFVPHVSTDGQLSLLENNGTIDNSLVLESYLQDSINAIKNFPASLDLSPGSVNEETQTDNEIINREASESNGNNSYQSKRKYIQHIFEKKSLCEENVSNRSDNNCNVSQESISGNYDGSRRRVRDFPLLQIEKNYSADESDSVSESVSSDQGTVKLKSHDASQNSAANFIVNENLLSIRKVIPRSISGQVLTDDDDENSLGVNKETSSNSISNEKIESHIDVDESTSSSEEECSSDSSDYSDTKEGDFGISKDIDRNTRREYATNPVSAQNNLNDVKKEFDSLNSSMTQSISSSDASSFVYKENSATSSSFDTKPPKSRQNLPMSLTSSFYSTICHSNNQDNNEEINCSLSDIRSVSTPDLKRLAIVTSTSSPYISLDDITPKADDCEFNNSSDEQSSCYSDTLNDSYLNSIPADEIVNEGSIHSSTEWGSADELDHHVLKTYRRPLRPASITAPTDQNSITQSKISKDSVSNQSSINDTTSFKEKRRAKRTRNQSVISEIEPNYVRKTSQSAVNESTFIVTDEKREDRDSKQSDKKLYNSILNTASQSVYLARKKKENASGSLKISLPRNPIGFDSILASQVAQKARNLTSGLGSKNKTEEVFGDPDSE